MVDYSFWDSYPKYSSNQAAWLWHDSEPEKEQFLNEHMPERVKAIRKLLIEAADKKEIGFEDTRDVTRIGGQIIYHGDIFFLREHLKKWAENKGFKPKFLFPEMREIKAQVAIKPAYLDEQNEMYSMELAIAIKAWDQVLSSNPPKPKSGSRKKLILDWLEEHHKSLSTQAKNRIAELLNPDKNGGAPPTL